MKKFSLVIFAFILLSCTKEQQLAVDLGGDITIEAYEAYVVPVTCTPYDKTLKVQLVPDDSYIAYITPEGALRGFHIGTTTLRAYVDSICMAECLVTVTEATVKSVELNKHKLKMGIGDTDILWGKVEPTFVDSDRKKLLWSTTDDSVISIRALTECEVTAVKEGTAKVIAKTINGIADTCTIEVSRVPLEGISFENPTISMEETDIHPLNIVFQPSNATNKNISHNVADENVVEIIDNQIHAKSIGETTITATSEDGGYTATCSVKVSLKGIDIIMFEDKILVGSSTSVWSESIATGEAYLGAIWESSNPYVATVVSDGEQTNSALVKANNLGVTTITAYSNDYSKCGRVTLTVVDITDLVSFKGDYDNISGSIPGNLSFRFNGVIENNSTQPIILKQIIMQSVDGTHLYYLQLYDEIIYGGNKFYLEPITAVNLYMPAFVCYFEWNGTKYCVINKRWG